MNWYEQLMSFYEGKSTLFHEGLMWNGILCVNETGGITDSMQ
jgi:hypothetical protein